MKRRSTGAHGLTPGGLLENVSHEELAMLRRYPYEEPGTVRGTREIKMAQSLIERGLLEVDPTVDALCVRCTERGMEAAASLRFTSSKNIREYIEKDVEKGHLLFAEQMLSMFMYRFIGELTHEIGFLHPYIETIRKDVAYCETQIRAAREKRHEATLQDVKVLRSKRKQIVESVSEGFAEIDKLLDEVRQKHHPETLLRSDFRDDVPPFTVDVVDQEDDEP